MSQLKDPTKKHIRCPDCDSGMASAFIRINHNKKRKWSNKDIKVCTNPICGAILTHIPRNFYIKKTRFNVARKLGMSHIELHDEETLIK